MLLHQARGYTASSRRTTPLDELLSLIQQPAWAADAACKEHPELPWMTERGESMSKQLAICRCCLVRVECLAAGLRGHEDGIWGGTSGRQRRRLVVSEDEADTRLSELLELDEAKRRSTVRGLPDARRAAVALKADNPTLSKQAIADRLGVHITTVLRWLSAGTDGNVANRQLT
jgi:hypothetical protein